eukprot:scaffold110807_cov41-Phaeocystis_antarctica.AAC.1
MTSAAEEDAFYSSRTSLQACSEPRSTRVTASSSRLLYSLVSCIDDYTTPLRVLLSTSKHSTRHTAATHNSRAWHR